MTNSPIPTVTLNGSLLGYVTGAEGGEMGFEEIAAFPLQAEEVDRAVGMAEELLAGGVKDILLFYYPRDWRMGETIWTPVPERVIAVKERYVSASSVTAVDIEKLRAQLHAEDICMIFLLVDVPGEQLMAYQHTQRSNFFTTNGVDKLFGAQRMADVLGFDLASSVGAGDTELDRFLSGVGLAVIVGGLSLQFQGIRETIRLRDSFELGDALFQLAEMVSGGQSGAVETAEAEAAVMQAADAHIRAVR